MLLGAASGCRLTARHTSVLLFLGRAPRLRQTRTRGDECRALRTEPTVSLPLVSIAGAAVTIARGTATAAHQDPNRIPCLERAISARERSAPAARTRRACRRSRPLGW